MADFKNGQKIIRKNTPSRQKYKDDYEEIIRLWKEGRPRGYIKNKFNLSSSTLHYILKRLGLENPPPRSVSLSKYQKSVLVGTILGDSHITGKNSSTSYLNFAHCIAQKEYFDFKVSVLDSLDFSYNKRYSYIDKRTGRMIDRFICNSRCCEELKELRKIFYPEGKKIIPLEYLKENFDEVSLAYLYMDDGSSYKYNTIISLQAFTKEDLEAFIDLLKRKFDLDFTIQKKLSIRIKQKDVKKFKNLIRPEVEKIKCMTYKL